MNKINKIRNKFVYSGCIELWRCVYFAAAEKKKNAEKLV